MSSVITSNRSMLNAVDADRPDKLPMKIIKASENRQC
ncbi:MAG: hypothetical protein ACI9WC_001230 [Arenicella sp.]